MPFGEGTEGGVPTGTSCDKLGLSASYRRGEEEAEEAHRSGAGAGDEDGGVACVREMLRGGRESQRAVETPRWAGPGPILQFSVTRAPPGIRNFIIFWTCLTYGWPYRLSFFGNYGVRFSLFSKKLLSASLFSG